VYPRSPSFAKNAHFSGQFKLGGFSNVALLPDEALIRSAIPYAGLP